LAGSEGSLWCNVLVIVVGEGRSVDVILCHVPMVVVGSERGFHVHAGTICVCPKLSKANRKNVDLHAKNGSVGIDTTVTWCCYLEIFQL
jgi:hypothetical protein